MKKILILLATCWAIGIAAVSYGDDSPWQSIKTGKKIVLMRHALAPGVGDPANFRIGDCATQRNLSATGVAQAKAIGDAFRKQGIQQVALYTSQWCRCQDTAENLALGDVSPLPLLNSFFQERDKQQQQTTALKQWLSQQAQNEPVVLVTHQVNITALTGIIPASGEMVLITLSTDGEVTSAETLMVE